MGVQREGTAGVKLKLGLPEEAVRAGAMHAEQPHGWRKTRLLAVKLAGSGEWTSAEVAEVCGVSHGRVFEWLRIVRERGLDALLERGRTGPREGVCRGVRAGTVTALKAKLEAGEFTTAQAARRCLRARHRVERPYLCVWRWLKKIRRSAEGAASCATPGKSRERGRSSRRGCAKSSGRSGLRPGAR